AGDDGGKPPAVGAAFDEQYLLLVVEGGAHGAVFHLAFGPRVGGHAAQALQLVGGAPGLVEQVAARLVAREAAAGDGLHVARPDDHHVVAEVPVIVGGAGVAQAVCNGVENALGRVAVVVVDAVRAFGRYDGHGRRVFRQAGLGVELRPRGLGMLGDAIADAA